VAQNELITFNSTSTRKSNRYSPSDSVWATCPTDNRHVHLNKGPVLEAAV